MEDKIKLQQLINEYNNLQTIGSGHDKKLEIRDLVIKMKKDKVEFYTHEYLDTVKKGTVTEVKRMGIILRQVTKEYEKVAITARYNFEVSAYE